MKIYIVKDRRSVGDFSYGDTSMDWEVDLGVFSSVEKAIDRVKRYLEESYNDIRRFDNDELIEIEDVCTILKEKTSVVYFNNHYEIDGDWREIVIYERELDEDLKI